jgi:hypothetical protein
MLCRLAASHHSLLGITDHQRISLVMGKKSA